MKTRSKHHARPGIERLESILALSTASPVTELAMHAKPHAIIAPAPPHLAAMVNSLGPMAVLSPSKPTTPIEPLHPASPAVRVIHSLAAIPQVSINLRVGAISSSGVEKDLGGPPADELKKSFEAQLKIFGLKVAELKADVSVTKMDIDHASGGVVNGSYKAEVKAKGPFGISLGSHTFSGNFQLNSSTGAFKADVQIFSFSLLGKKIELRLPVDTFKSVLDKATRGLAQAVENYLTGSVGDQFAAAKAQVESAGRGNAFVASRGFTDNVTNPKVLLKSGITSRSPMTSTQLGRLAVNNSAAFQSELRAIASWAGGKGVRVDATDMYNRLSRTGQTDFGRLGLGVEPVSYQYRALGGTIVTATQFLLVARIG